MTALLVVVIALGVLALLVGARLRRAPAQAVMGPEGYQEATITINGRYRPDRIRVEKGVPVRLHFVRMEDNPCSERVIISGVGVERRLPAFRETTIEFTPMTPGIFLFTCQWGMYRGKLVVTEHRGRSRVGRSQSGESHDGDQR